MKIHCFQHVGFEGLAGIENWIISKGHQLAYTKFFNGDALPEMNELDFLIVMGGPMSFDDDDVYSWMKAEKAFIKSAIENDKTVLGICLGAQMIAEVIDGSGRRGHSQEIGWFDLAFEKKLLPDGLKFLPDSICGFHWHGDTFDIPKGAVRLAGTGEYPNQAFLFKNNVMAFQFHLEMNEQSVEAMVKHCGNDLKPNKFVQPDNEILKGSFHCNDNFQVMERILDYLEKNT